MRTHLGIKESQSVGSFLPGNENRVRDYKFWSVGDGKELQANRV